MINQAYFKKATVVAFFCFLLLGASFNLDFFSILNFYDQKRINQLWVLSFITAILLMQQLNFSNYHLTFLLAISLVGVNSSFQTNYVGLALTEVLGYSFLVILASFYASQYWSSASYKILVLIVFISILLYCFKFFIGLLGATIQDRLVQPATAITGFVNVNFLAQALGMIIPLLFASLLIFHKRSYRITTIMLLSICWLILLVIANRGVPLAIMVSFFALVIVDRAVALKALKILAVSLILTGFFYALLYYLGLFDRVGDITTITQDSARLTIWADALKTWQQNPWFGIGPYGFALTPNSFGLSHPHNFYLQILLEWGVIAFTLLLIFLSMLTVKLYKNAKLAVAHKNWFVLGCIIATVEGLTHAFFSGVLTMPLSQTLFFIVLGIALSPVVDPAVHPEVESSKHSLGIIISGPLLIAYRAIIATVFIVYCVLVYNSYQLQDSNCLANIGPRFWIEGGRIPCP